ncbi:hypothetical protein MPSEU_000635500 [Mayamaea pseudoterrestris]|nr:hypothetical protein MPSEU_000635500 [Mayamaea pseudoterrestris]
MKSNARWLFQLLLASTVAQHQAMASAAIMGKHGHIRKDGVAELLAKKEQQRIEFACPSFIPEAANADENQKAWYDDVSADVAENVTEFIHSFREKEEYDNWGHSYDHVKQEYTSFKSKYFAPNLSNNMFIYESASGIGLNLLMTLEILEQHQIEGLVVYGNEYVHDSVDVSRQLLGTQELPAKAKLGLICQSDSSNLRHVPSDSFDLVYTGYITPMMNPLELNVDRHDIYTAYADICQPLEGDSVERTTEKKEMRERSQVIQDAWYRTWVSEMIRIARPGAPVIVEQVSFPKCQNFQDWGGVDLTFWKRSIEEYGWDIDPSSVVFEKESVFGSRYHVFMRKNEVTADVANA